MILDERISGLRRFFQRSPESIIHDHHSALLAYLLCTIVFYGLVLDYSRNKDYNIVTNKCFNRGITMALINCPECGHPNVSSTASRCSQCGCNIAKKRKTKLSLIALAIYLVFIIVMFNSCSLFDGSSSGRSTRDRGSGYCDVCGARATTYWGSHEVCSRCYTNIWNTDID